MYRLTVILLAAGLAPAQVKTFKPGFNLFSVEQDIAMGKKAAIAMTSSPATWRASVHGLRIRGMPDSSDFDSRWSMTGT
jgi:hypothetical protein